MDAAVVRAVRRQHPELSARWAAIGETVVCRVVVSLTRNGAPAGHIALVVALDGTGGSVGFPGGASVALSARLTNPPGARAGFRWSWQCPKLDTSKNLSPRRL